MASYCHYTETWTNVAWSNAPKSCQQTQIAQPTNLQNLAEFWPVTLEIWPLMCLSIIGTPQEEICKPNSRHCSLKSSWRFFWLGGKLGLGCSLTETLMIDYVGDGCVPIFWEESFHFVRNNLSNSAIEKGSRESKNQWRSHLRPNDAI